MTWSQEVCECPVTIGSSSFRAITEKYPFLRRSWAPSRYLSARKRLLTRRQGRVLSTAPAIAKPTDRCMPFAGRPAFPSQPEDMLHAAIGVASTRMRL